DGFVGWDGLPAEETVDGLNLRGSLFPGLSRGTPPVIGLKVSAHYVYVISPHIDHGIGEAFCCPVVR
ncbi:hypothetical protein, partial [Streptomyces sp. SID5770]|uniref:hypothetical protein n=1 Tax=Streptomyces sp. SID5770 TaxID=2690308 RepID=UPI001F2DE40A